MENTKNGKFGTIFGMVLLALFCVTFFSGCNLAGEEIIIPYDEKIFWHGTIDDNFCGSTVIVVMDRNFSGINKVHHKNFFGNIEIESIRDLTYVPENVSINLENFRQILLLTLPVYCKENVVKAIRHLEKIIGIMHVSPNNIVTGGV